MGVPIKIDIMPSSQKIVSCPSHSLLVTSPLFLRKPLPSLLQRIESHLSQKFTETESDNRPFAGRGSAFFGSTQCLLHIWRVRTSHPQWEHVPLYRYNTIPWTDPSLALRTKPPWIFSDKYFYEHICSFLLCKYLGVVRLDYRNKCVH